jgi:8-oxo-dGTP pyrophosphatase MutT (NUDIX family)
MPISSYLRSLREKVGHAPLIIPGVTALVFDNSERLLLHRSSDDGLWHTIGGAMELNEQPADAVVREVMEETGLIVMPEAITGVRTRPPTTYSNGDICHYITVEFKCRIIGGELAIGDDESFELQFFAENELPQLSEIDRLTVTTGFNFTGTTFWVNDSITKV